MTLCLSLESQLCLIIILCMQALSRGTAFSIYNKKSIILMHWQSATFSFFKAFIRVVHILCVRMSGRTVLFLLSVKNHDCLNHVVKTAKTLLSLSFVFVFYNLCNFTFFCNTPFIYIWMLHFFFFYVFLCNCAHKRKKKCLLKTGYPTKKGLKWI